MGKRLPNLELMEFQFMQQLHMNQRWLKKFRELRKENKYLLPDYDAIMFPQTWGSTCTAFDVTQTGDATIGGSAMTEAYTVVFEEGCTHTFGVFVDNKFCYIVYDPTESFYEDLNNCNIVSLSKAKVRY